MDPPLEYAGSSLWSTRRGVGVQEAAARQG